MPDFKWKLYYEDGSTFTDKDGYPWESPVAGLVCVAQPDADEDVLGSRDFFLYRADEEVWIECDRAGADDQLSHFGHSIAVFRIGRQVPDREKWRRIFRAAVLEVRGK